MPQQLNRVSIQGRLVREPSTRETANGKIARFTLAVDRAGKNKGADFPSCVAFGNTAQFVERYLNKGSWIIVDGRLSTNSYTDRNGNKVFTTDIMVNDIFFCGSKKDDGNGAPAPAQAQGNNQQNNDNDPMAAYYEVPHSDGFDDDEVPFS